MRKRFVFCSVVLLLIAALPAIAQQRGALSPDTVAKIETAVQAELERQKIPGLSVAIAVDGELRYTKGFGFADLENSVPAKATTRFRTASIAKPQTAVAVMRLAEQGKLDLDTPIQKYCPAFPEKQWPVTARQVLGHLAGIRHYTRPGEASGTEHFFTLNESLRIFKDDPLLHEPGTRYFYSTYGFVLLGCAVEGASGMRFDAYMQQNVWGPAGMASTRTDDQYQIIPERSRWYSFVNEQQYARLPEAAKAQAKPNSVYNASLHDTSMKIPGGGLLSTSADLVRFALALVDARLVKPETRDRMWTRQKTSAGQETNYGLGWGVGEMSGVRVVSHSGGQAGSACLLTILPDKKVVVAVMTNMDGAAPGRIISAIVQVLVPEARPPAPQP
jgi:CubicO group peptidase (beta-lactamase class C family)